MINSIVRAFIYCMFPKAYVAIFGNTQYHLTTSFISHTHTHTLTNEGEKCIITGLNTHLLTFILIQAVFVHILLCELCALPVGAQALSTVAVQLHTKSWSA